MERWADRWERCTTALMAYAVTNDEGEPYIPQHPALHGLIGEYDQLVHEGLEHDHLHLDNWGRITA